MLFPFIASLSFIFFLFAVIRKSYSLLLSDLLYLLSSDESDSLDDGYGSGSSGTYYVRAFLFVLEILLVVFVAWGLAFLYQQESSPNVISFVCRVCTKRSQIQRWSTHQNVLALKFLFIFPNLKLSFRVLVMI